MQHPIQDLEHIARIIRARIVETSHKTQTPHLGSCLSCVDILVAAYFEVLQIDPARPADEGRDRFILSKGHGAAALFQVLALRGFYPESMLDTYGQDGGVFAEHPPTPSHLPGIEAATGSLGHGFPMGLGMALAARIRKQRYKVFALVSDGECNEGSTWEAAMLAASQKMENLAVIVDFNKWQATGRSEDIMVCKRMKASFADCVEVVGERLGKDASYQLDSSKLRTQLGWQDRIPLEEGIDETIAWVDHWLDDLKQQPFDYVHKP